MHPRNSPHIADDPRTPDRFDSSLHAGFSVFRRIMRMQSGGEAPRAPCFFAIPGIARAPRALAASSFAQQIRAAAKASSDCQRAMSLPLEQSVNPDDDRIQATICVYFFAPVSRIQRVKRRRKKNSPYNADIATRGARGDTPMRQRTLQTHSRRGSALSAVTRSLPASNSQTDPSSR